GYETAAFPSVPHVGEGFAWRGFDVLEAARGELRAAAVTERFLEWLAARDDDRPFFAWLHYFDPHAPYDPPAEVAKEFYAGDPLQGEKRLADEPFIMGSPGMEYLREWLGERRDPEYPRAMYAAEVSYTDRQLGRVLGWMSAHGLDEKIAIVVVADHGESLGEHGIFYDHAGLYEQQLKVPLLVRVPGFPAGLRLDAPVGHEDLAPTIAELFGLELRNDVEGLSLAALLRGEKSAAVARRKSLIHEHAQNLLVAMRSGPWKLILPVERRHFLPSSPVLFDLSADAGELRTLADTHPQVVSELRQGLESRLELGVVGHTKREPGDEEAVQRLRALGYVQ
ncbi:MAG: sulfatase family protein, partial [Candidatus Binatia bacterium]